MVVWIDEMCVKVSTEYDLGIFEILKKVGNGKWDKNLRIWKFPLEKYDVLVKIRDNYNKKSCCRKIFYKAK